MTDEEVARAAGIPVALAYAIRVVESGKRPHPHAVRFEPVLFHKHRPDLAAKFPYTPPKGTAEQTGRAALDRAMALDPQAAVESSSFGSYQDLGRVLLSVTGLPPREAVAAFDADPDGFSARMLVRWLKLRPKFLEEANEPAPNFDRLGMLYNGKHSYGPLLKAAHDAYLARWPEVG